ncbi:MAG TPA: 2-C-methyl-D-erythritol 2,4-cyclodiphosphate synthase, partial [Bacteroidia bacterium]|nr:2-C-methyl-D-erythritol 2,4-cyclodiphosphate synthase [Bacteroidia bacterium]
MAAIRIGFGFDVHQLVPGRELWLGGILLQYEKGCLGHSDADVLIHAICDALLGAANLRDIGYHFPNTDPRFKGADSKSLLRHVAALIREAGYEIGNIDATLCMEQPKINPHIPLMQKTMAEVMGIPVGDISVKATTNEGLGYVGRE